MTTKDKVHGPVGYVKAYWVKGDKIFPAFESHNTIQPATANALAHLYGGQGDDYRPAYIGAVVGDDVTLFDIVFARFSTSEGPSGVSGIEEVSGTTEGYNGNAVSFHAKTDGMKNTTISGLQLIAADGTTVLSSLDANVSIPGTFELAIDWTITFTV